MSPEAMLDATRLAISYLRKVNPSDVVVIDHEDTSVSDVIADLEAMERTLYLLVESRRVKPFARVPAGFESMGYPRVTA